ncbi:MAG: aldo/keto reductase [Chromatiales bacterium]|jgi:aryl-alcohol dehydrogenase-like predicted oxidoreductase
MEYVQVPDTDLEIPRIALGSWAIGGWMWGGAEESGSIETIHTALDKGMTLIDTAPVYGFGQSEAIVGKALATYGDRRKVRISSKATLAWDEGRIYRDGSRDRVMRDLEGSLKRLGTDRIDIYYVHWPDPGTPIPETARAMRELYEQGAIGAIGVSNYTPDQMHRFRAEAPLHFCQPPYNIFERAIELDVMPYCQRHGIVLMTYGALCRGMLSGKMSRDRRFHGDDLRRLDPKFNEPRLSQYLNAAARLKDLARSRFGCGLAAFSLRYVLEKGIPVTIWGARSPDQLDPVDEMLGWSMDYATLSAVDTILAQWVKDPVGPEFMAPPTGMEG